MLPGTLLGRKACKCLQGDIPDLATSWGQMGQQQYKNGRRESQDRQLCRLPALGWTLGAHRRSKWPVPGQQQGGTDSESNQIIILITELIGVRHVLGAFFPYVISFDPYNPRILVLFLFLLLCMRKVKYRLFK